MGILNWTSTHICFDPSNNTSFNQENSLHNAKYSDTVPEVSTSLFGRVTTYLLCILFTASFLPVLQILAPTHISTARVLYFFWYSFNTKTCTRYCRYLHCFLSPQFVHRYFTDTYVSRQIFFSQCNIQYIVHIFGYSGHTLEICSRNLWKLNCPCLSE